MTMRVHAIGAALALLALPGLALAQSSLKEVESPGAAKHQSAVYRTHTIDIPLKAAGDVRGEHELEYMVKMKAGDVLLYSWDGAEAGAVHHEFHGHTEDSVTFYKKAEGAPHHGSLAAPFDGIHGWYLENRGASPTTVRLQLAGYYELIEPGESGNNAALSPN